MSITDKPVRTQLLTGETAMSVSIVVILIGCAAFFLREMSSLREEIQPKIATISSQIDTMIRDVQQMNSRLDRLPTASDVAVQINSSTLELHKDIDEIKERLTKLESGK